MELINRAKDIMFSPKIKWGVIAAEEPNSNRIIKNYVMPLTFAAAIASFIGYGLIGFGIFGVRIAGIGWGIYYAVIVLIRYIVGTILTAFVVDALAPSFGSVKNYGRSLQLVAYGATPSLLAALFAIMPVLSAIAALAGAVYSTYLLYLGLEPVMKTPEDKKAIYLIATIVVLLVVYFVIGLILTALILPLIGLSFAYSLY